MMRSIAVAKIRKFQFKHNAQTMIVSVDIGKDKNCTRFRDLEGNDSPPFEFSNSRAGFDKFLDRIRSNKVRCGARRVVVGFESTGCYGVPLSHFLNRHGITTYLINPVHTKRVKEIRDNSPCKTDQKDPRVIADIMQLGCTLSVIIPKGAAADLRQLVHARERALEMVKTQHNQLHGLVFQIFPEFNHVVKNLLSRTSLYLLEQYTTPDRLAQAPADELTALLGKISRGRVSAEKTASLLEAARNHGGITEGVVFIALEICQLVKAVNQLAAYISELEDDMKRILKTLPSSRALLSIGGIGTITAAAVIGETAAFEGMTHAAEFEKLAGLNLFEISSGKHQGRRRISKRGRSLLRKMLYFAAINVVKKPGVFQEKYQSCLRRGMPKNKALTAVSRKLVRVIFAVVRDNAEFDSEYRTVQPLKKAA